MPVPAYRERTTAAADQAEKAVRGGDGDGALSEAEVVRRGLAAERLNRTVSLPECLCIRPPRIVSYAEVGDPNGIVAFFLLGVDSHRYMSFLLDKHAKARGVRLICLDRPGRGRTSDFENNTANRVLEFPEILRHFCKVVGITCFSLVGQSLGASYALRCAQEMQDKVATTVYLISPWVPLSVPGSSRALNTVEKFPAWAIRAAMTMGTAMPRLLAATGGLGLMVKGCSEEEGLMFGSETTAEVLKAVGDAHEQTHGVAMDALAALEKTQSLGFDYRDVSMPVHVFHGRADHMVPFPAVQWMSEEMPACTVSVKMGGTHALLMDGGVLDCVLECMCEDFKHFEEHAASRREGPHSRPAAAGKGPVPAFSFPAHTQHFQEKGYLLCREGVLIKGWTERYFILDGYELHQFDAPTSATARRVVDLRGTVAKLQGSDGEVSPSIADTHDRVFPFKLLDPQHRVLHELCASSAEDRANWVETLTKASRFSKGSGDEKRQAALSKSFLVTTRATSGRGIAGAGLGGAGTGTGRAGAGAGAGFGARSSGRIDRSRRQTISSTSTQAVDEQTISILPNSPMSERGNTRGEPIGLAAKRATTPGGVLSRRNVTRDLLHGTPSRQRAGEGSRRPSRGQGRKKKDEEDHA